MHSEVSGLRFESVAKYALFKAFSEENRRSLHW